MDILYNKKLSGGNFKLV